MLSNWSSRDRGRWKNGEEDGLGTLVQDVVTLLVVMEMSIGCVVDDAVNLIDEVEGPLGGSGFRGCS